MTTESSNLGENIIVHYKNFRWGVLESNSSTNYGWYETNRRWRNWNTSAPPWKSTLPYSVQKIDIWPKPFLVTADTPAYGVYLEQSGVTTVKASHVLGHATAVDATDSINECKNACFDLARGQSFDAPVFVAELHKTQELVHSFAQKVARGARLLSDFAAGGLRPARLLKSMASLCGSPLGIRASVLNDAAKAWLIYRYAISTGILDITEAARWAADVLLRRRPEISFRSNRTVEPKSYVVEIRDGEWDPPFLLGPSGRLVFTDTGTHWATVSAWLKCSPRNQTVYEANQLGLVNLPGTIWELIPLSFVLDWALDIGNYLQRLPTLAELTVIDSGYQVAKFASGTISAAAYNSYYTTTTYDGEGVEYSAMSYNRTPWPNPAPVWTPELRMNNKRVIDAISLIATASFGRFNPKQLRYG